MVLQSLFSSQNQKLSVPILVAILSIIYFKGRSILKYGQRINIPHQLLDHTTYYYPSFIPEDTGRKLNELIRQMQNYTTNVVAGSFSVHEDIGEGEPLVGDVCTNSFLIPNSDKSKCILPQRIDIGKHFVMTGGVDANREFREAMISRVSSFGVYMIDSIENYPVINELFVSENFQTAAKKICPSDKQVLDPFQFNFIIQIPGQTVALHIDAPYFWGASRFQLPQWLLAAMVFSNLFADRFIDQVQVVGYLHDRFPESGDGGDFVYYPDNKGYLDVPSNPLSASAVDGSKVVHASTVYRPDFPGGIPYLNKDKTSKLRYDGDEKWSLLSNEELIREYNSSDIRISIVYRARCFRNTEEVNKYAETIRDNNHPDSLTLEHVLATFENDLVKKGVLRANDVTSLSKFDLAMKILDTYVAYPYPSENVAAIPFNYCAAGNLYPVLKWALHLFCG